METKRKAVMRSQAESVSASLSPKMDPSLWSLLAREHLQDIFDALPVKDHYRLGMVCKDWQKRVRERCRVLTHDPVRVKEPFFLLLEKSWLEGSPCGGTIALHAESGQWMWRPSHPLLRGELDCDPFEIGHPWESFEVEGVLSQAEYFYECANNRTVLSLLGDRDVLYDVHRKHDKDEKYDPRTDSTFLTLLEYVNAAPGSVLGMMVDDATRAYTLVLGSCIANTLVLDSSTKKWESKPSRLVRRSTQQSVSFTPKSCVQFEGKMYLWMDSDEIHVYCSSSDQWSALVPPRDVWDEGECRGLGHWAGALYAVTKNKPGTLSVWKLNMADEQWSEYAQIPGRLFRHLTQRGFVSPIVASHCNGYFLLHVVQQPKRGTRFGVFQGKFVLLNISNRRWEIVEMKGIS